jgi:hypothetical protein
MPGKRGCIVNGQDDVLSRNVSLATTSEGGGKSQGFWGKK